MNFEISNPMEYRAALYIRLSKEDESEGLSGSVINQKTMLEGFARENRIFVYDSYIDDGYSGTSFDRPSFQRMIQDIEAKKVNMVITKDLSRLGRDYILTGHYMERYFPEKRVRYISLLDGIDTGVESSANDITPFRAIMNDMYAKDISKKIKSVKRNKQHLGQFIGGKATFGYMKHPTEKNRIVVDENAAPIVRRIFAMAKEGISCRKIAITLNEEHVPTPATYAGLKISKPGSYSGKWSSEHITEMLRNEVYIGNMVQGRTARISYKSKKMLRQDKDQWIVVKGTHEPLVDAETFDKVQRLIDSRQRTHSSTYDFLLKGMIFCKECGHPLGVINRKGSEGETCLYFICRTYSRFSIADVCTCHCVKEETVTKAVLQKVQEVCKAYLNPTVLQALAEKLLAENKQADTPEKELQAVKKQVSSFTERMDKVYMDMLNGLLTDEDFHRIYDRLKADRTKLLKKQEQLTKALENPVPIADQARELVTRYLDSAGTSRELLVDLIERIELSADKQVFITFRFDILNNLGKMHNI